MLSTDQLIAFTPATDLGRARAFYEGVLGLRVVDHNSYACVLDANGTMLRVTAVAEVGHHDYTVLGWRVRDIEQSVSDLASRGVEFIQYGGMEQDELGIWTTPNGDRIAWFRDPGGNVLSLTQFL